MSKNNHNQKDSSTSTDQGAEVNSLIENENMQEENKATTTNSKPVHLEEATFLSGVGAANQVEDAKMLEEHRLLEKQRERDVQRINEQDVQIKSKAAELSEAVEAKRTQKEVRKHKGKVTRRYRLIPIWLRILLVLVFCVLAVLAGAYVGYVILGNGDPDDVFKKETWQHIVDLVNQF